MKNERLLEAIGEIDDALIEGARYVPKAKKKAPAWMRWGSLAACLCLAVVGVSLIRGLQTGDRVRSFYAVGEDGVTVLPREFSLAASAAAEVSDMIGFFIYGGRTYVAYEWIPDAGALVGAYLGCATGMIDEWTRADGYVEYAGSVMGDFHAVNGYDPSFLLCMPSGTGATVYICDSGITLKYGAELYEDRLHLSENATAVRFETAASGYYGKEMKYDLPSESLVAIGFGDALNAALFLPWDGIAAAELYHMYIETSGGMTVHLRIYEDGYVRFAGLLDVCVQLPHPTFNALTELLDGYANEVKQ